MTVKHCFQHSTK